MSNSSSQNQTAEARIGSSSSSDGPAIPTPATGSSETLPEPPLIAKLGEFLAEFCSEVADEVGSFTADYVHKKLPVMKDLIAAEIQESSRRKTEMDRLAEEVQSLKTSNDRRREETDFLLRRLEEQKDMISSLREAFHKQIHRPFAPQDCGFFNPSPSLREIGYYDFATKGGTAYYEKVELFIEAFQAASSTIPIESIRQNLHRCLVGTARTWYNSELSTRERYSAMTGDGLQNWIKLLRTKWSSGDPDKPLAQEAALADLHQMYLTPLLLQSAGSTAKFFTAAVGAARRMGLTTTYSQLALAYSRVTFDLQLTLPPPRQWETLDEFIRKSDAAARKEGVIKCQPVVFSLSSMM